MKTEKEQCIHYYQAEAAHYDKRRFMCHCRQFYDQLAKNVVSEHLRTAVFVLDAGAGTGRFALYLAQQGKQVVAFDRSFEMLEETRKKAHALGILEHIVFVQGDIESLPFRNEIFDGIVSFHVLVHFKCIEKILGECARVLKREGVFTFELAHNMFSRLYTWLRTNMLRRPFSFPDYYRNVRSVSKDLVAQHLTVTQVRTIKKVPGPILHFLTCIVGCAFLLPFCSFIERINAGALRILKTVKET